MSINKVILVGNVGQDPEVKHLDNNVALARFSLATSETYVAKNGEKVSTTEWHNIVLWRGLADLAEKYIRKGKQIYVEGRIRTRSWDDKDGNKRYTTEIYGDVVRLLSGREGSVQDASGQERAAAAMPAARAEVPDFESEPEDDLPF